MVIGLNYSNNEPLVEFYNGTEWTQLHDDGWGKDGSVDSMAVPP